MRYHQRAIVLTPHLETLTIKLVTQHACAHEGMLQVQFVNATHERQIGRADKSGQIVHAAPADAGQLRLAAD